MIPLRRLHALLRALNIDDDVPADADLVKLVRACGDDEEFASLVDQLLRDEKPPFAEHADACKLAEKLHAIGIASSKFATRLVPLLRKTCSLV